jgi:hypothetical protein
MALLGVASLTASAAHAGGYGIYTEDEHAWTSIEGDLSFNSPVKVNRDFDGFMRGVGFLYDTNVATDTLINYRVRVGYRAGKRNWNKKRTVTLESRTCQEDPLCESSEFKQDSETVQGLTFNQTLGFGLIRRPEYRVWMGPTMRVNVDWYGADTHLDIVDVSVGGGPEIGVNYHLNDRMSATASFSYNFMYFGEYFETVGHDKRFDGSQHLLTLSVGFLFRTEFDLFED